MKYPRVLLADSHLSMLEGVHSLLDALFETVLMVADEQSLMETLTVFKPDLVVVDLSLPGAGEANIARRLMERHPELRLIILSVHDDPSVAVLVRNSGAAGFVLKRSAATELVPAVHEVLRGSG
jgi:DNA-binding NarL/FixJ family response regulator